MCHKIVEIAAPVMEQLTDQTVDRPHLRLQITERGGGGAMTQRQGKHRRWIL